MMRRDVLTGIIAVALLTCVAFAQDAEPEQQDRPPRLFVSGEAEIRKPADEMYISIGFVSEHADAEAALNENSRTMTEVVKALKRAGLDDDEMTTGRFRVSPTYSRRPRGAEPDWQPQIIGFSVSNSINVRTGRLEDAGAIIQAASRAGANSIDNIRFGLADHRAYRQEAIAEATANAIADAKVLADAAGVELVRIISITLYDASPSPMAESGMLAMARVADAAAPPIQSGDVTVAARVRIIYEIKDRP